MKLMKTFEGKNFCQKNFVEEISKQIVRPLCLVKFLMIFQMGFFHLSLQTFSRVCKPIAFFSKNFFFFPGSL